VLAMRSPDCNRKMHFAHGNDAPDSRIRLVSGKIAKVMNQPLKIFYLKKRILFPFCTLSVTVKLTDDSKTMKKGDRILAFTVRSIIDILFYKNRLATLAEVAEATSDGRTIKLTLKGLSRVRITRLLKFKNAEFNFIDLDKAESNELIMEGLRKKSQELVFLINVDESDKLIKLLDFIVDLNQMTDFIANYFIMDFTKRFRIYKEIEMRKRGRLLIAELAEVIDKMTKKRKKTAL
jgi:ATP-dependent Lon protease